MKLYAARGPRLACIVLAAGGSARLGRPKQLLRVRGRSLLAQAVGTAARFSATPPIVVLGAQRLRLRALLERSQQRCRIAANARWRDGLAGSLRAGIAALPRTADAALIVLVDQPRVDAAVLARLVSAWLRRPRVAAAACYAGKAGVPAILPRRLWQAAAQLRGDEGARALLRAARELTLVDLPEAELDVDTEADAARLAGDPPLKSSSRNSPSPKHRSRSAPSSRSARAASSRR